MGGMFKGPTTGSFLRVRFFDAANCGGNSIDTADLSLNTITPDWKQYWESFAAPPTTASARVGVYGLQLYVDQMFVGTGAQF